MNFGGVGRLSAANNGGGGALGSIGGGGIRDSRNSSTALRPSMMHARSSELNKRLQSMKASENSSAARADGGGRRNRKRRERRKREMWMGMEMEVKMEMEMEMEMERQREKEGAWSVEVPRIARRADYFWIVSYMF